MGRQLKSIGTVLIWVLFLLEFLFLTYWNGKIGAHKSALVLFSASLGIGLIGLYFSLNESKVPKIDLSKQNWQKYIWPIAIACLGAILVYFRLSEIFTAFEVSKNDVSQSDVIPQIMHMVERLLGGSFPYDPINDWGYQLNPTYLPLQWTPFVLAELVDRDYRWIPFTFLCLSIFYFQRVVYLNTNNIFLLVVFSLLPWLTWLLVINDEPKVLAYTIESLICAYYLFLGTAIYKKNPYLIGFAISLCLLSRFSLVLWLPLLGLVFLIEEKKKLLSIVGIPLFVLIFIYIIPFLSKDMEIFTNGLAHHTKAAVGEWQPYWQKATEKPYHLFRGVGLAGMFYDWVDGDILTRIKVLQKWHLGGIIISISGLLAFFLVKRKSIDVSIFLIASLKIYFCFFYYFIQIPYIYLMLVPLFTSLIVLLAVQLKLTHQH